MKDLKISKELLIEVLGSEYKQRLVDWFQIEDDNFLRTYYDCGSYDDKGRPTGLGLEINIYEFAFKCKEWILNQKNKDCFYIADQFSLNIESQMGVIKYFWCVLLKNNLRISPEFKADSELECILKACEFILTKRNQNENK